MFKKLFLISLIAFTLVACSEAEPEVVEEPEPEPEIEISRNIFDGSALDENEKIKYKAVAVMINNSAVARPQYGISEADIVYEVIKDEYYETRFMAIFEGEIPEKVGPLRSIRVPFVRIYNEWRTALVHYGGAGPVGQDGTANPDEVNALAQLQELFVPYRYDAVAGINDEYFFRTTDKPSPHNAYISLAEAFQDLEDIDMWPPEHFAWDEEAYSTSTESATTINIDYPTETPNLVTYEFDESTGQYLRFIEGKEHIDALYDKQISATNIIVQYAEHSQIKVYVLVEFKYAGKADFFIDGKHMSGTWTKDFEDDTTHWWLDDGTELVMQPGNTWIQVVETDADYINWE